MLPYVRTSEGLSVFCEGKNYVVRRDNVRFKKLVEYVNDGDKDSFIKLMNAENAIEQVANGVTDGVMMFKNGNLYRNGVQLPKDGLHSLFVTRLEALVNDGLSTKPLLAFLNKFLDNPSFNSRSQGLQFIERNELPITEDGDFLAYKALNSNYTDKHTGKVDNKPGVINEMPRVNVDDNPSNHCSSGYHVGALAYSGPDGWFYNSGNKCVIVKVNPRDIVSVPADHNCQKCRVCRYEVLGDYNSKLSKPVYTNKAESLSPSLYSGKWVYDFSRVNISDELVFNYTDANGTVKTRHVFVERKNEYNNTLTCTLHEDEEDGGSIRTFRWDRMDNIKVL